MNNNKPTISEIFNAVYINDLQFIQNYIQQGNDINVKNENQASLLHYACRFRNTKIIKFNINSFDYSHDTPLFIAIQFNFLPAIELLVNAGCNLEHINKNGESALHIVSVFSSQNTAPKIFDLISTPKTIELENKSGLTPLHLACSNERLDIIEKLLSLKVNINSQTRSGNTPLHLVIFDNACYSILKLLLDNGADFSIKNAKNQTPLELALSNPDCTKEHIQILKYFELKQSLTTVGNSSSTQMKKNKL